MGRLIVVSNRLPFTYAREKGGDRFKPSSGGLVTALTGYLEARRHEEGRFKPSMHGLIAALAAFLGRRKDTAQCLWMGWPGGEVEEKRRAAVRETALRAHGAWPVYLSAEEMDRFYLGFCNRTLWPLFHYFPSYATYEPELWEAYREVNVRFCDALLEIARPGDVFWIHDYQLLLLPGLVRARLPEASIGFFLHIPFPSFELFRLLPGRWRREILEGLLGADLIGFHTHDYAQYFLRCVFRTLGHDHHLGQIQIGDQIRRADTFPVGIDFGTFEEAARSEAVAAICERLRSELGGRKLLFSVDRLDYTKGILHRLLGYEEFLQQNPDWHGRVVFVMAVVPSREEVPQYRKMKSDLDGLVGRINGRFGRVDWVPILYQYRSLDFPDLVAHYRMADVALITPLRDGMNLVAKEYLACQVEEKGVLILSEMTGAARELGEAVQVNPNHRGELAEAIRDAFSMPEEERVRRNRPMRERLRIYDARHWAESFIAGIERVKSLQGGLRTQHLSPALAQTVWETRRRAQRPVLFLDYDGTLVPFAPLPHLAVPDDTLREVLEQLARAGNTVFLVSGRDRNALEGWFGTSPIGLIAEHGAWIREPGGQWEALKPIAADWKETLRPLLRFYVDRVPGSLVEEKDFSLAWHYRNVDPELGMARAKELIDDLVQYTANFEVQVLEGRKVVEVRVAGVHKGAAVLQVRNRLAPDFVLAMGDDQTDEDMFRSVGPDAVTVRVGSRFSLAQYSLSGVEEVRRFLSGFTTPASG
jgi:trehalose 6-phosphate synthase/phosphatase